MKNKRQRIIHWHFTFFIHKKSPTIKWISQQVSIKKARKLSLLFMVIVFFCFVYCLLFFLFMYFVSSFYFLHHFQIGRALKKKHYTINLFIYYIFRKHRLRGCLRYVLYKKMNVVFSLLINLLPFVVPVNSISESIQL